MIKRCALCAEEFQSKHHKKIYCSSDCQLEACKMRKREKTLLSCNRCGSSYEGGYRSSICPSCRTKGRFGVNRNGGRQMYEVGGSSALKCNKCGEIKLSTSFGDDSRYRYGKKTWCHKCYSDYQGEWRNTTRWRQWKYGISIEDQITMWDSQDGKCAICGTGIAVEGKETCLDHDHETGKVRGFICMSCNIILGHAKDSVDILMSATAYLLEHENVLHEQKLWLRD